MTRQGNYLYMRGRLRCVVHVHEEIRSRAYSFHDGNDSKPVTL